MINLNVKKMENEVFVWVKGFEGKYAVSNMARIWSENAKRFIGDIKNGRILKKNQYHKVNIARKSIRIHRIVALHFVHNPNPEKFNMVNHIDGNPNNCIASNLEWVDNSQNLKHAVRVLKKTKEKNKAKQKYYNEIKEGINFLIDNGFKEELKPIPLFEDKYMISNFGRVWSIKRKIFMYGFISSSNYVQIELQKHPITGKRYKPGMHQLVAEAFIPNPENKEVVHHVNENPRHNSVYNLAWATNSENILDSHKSKKNGKKGKIKWQA